MIRYGTGRYGTGLDDTGRDGTGRDGTGRYGLCWCMVHRTLFYSHLFHTIKVIGKYQYIQIIDIISINLAYEEVVGLLLN